MNIFQIHMSSSWSFSTAKISLLGKPNYNCSVATSMETRSHITSQTAPAGVSLAWFRPGTGSARKQRELTVNATVCCYGVDIFDEIEEHVFDESIGLA